MSTIDVSSRWGNVKPVIRTVYTNLTTPIQYMFVVVDKPVSNPAWTQKKNHWRLFFVLQPGGHSISMDMTTKANDGQLTTDIDRTGELTLHYKGYAVTDNAVTTFKYAVRPGLTLETVLHFIEERRFNYYEHTETGTGCRYWIKTVVNALVGAHMIGPASQDEDINEAIDYLWIPKWLARPKQVLSEIRAGEFLFS